jgi:hypothetical protein
MHLAAAINTAFFHRCIDAGLLLKRAVNADLVVDMRSIAKVEWLNLSTCEHPLCRGSYYCNQSRIKK